MVSVVKRYREDGSEYVEVLVNASYLSACKYGLRAVLPSEVADALVNSDLGSEYKVMSIEATALGTEETAGNGTIFQLEPISGRVGELQAIFKAVDYVIWDLKRYDSIG